MPLPVLGAFACLVGLFLFLRLPPGGQALELPLPGSESRKATQVEEATPDCEPSSASPYPVRQREQLLAEIGVKRWHQAGYRGRGVKIAVLDTGFRGYRRHLGQALPARVAVHSFRADGNLEARESQHGILCCEVLHALAPEAELLLANWDTESPEYFLEAARWARRQGARIISCSVIMPSWSDGEGGGPFHERLAQIVGPGSAAGDVLCFASAGNTAHRHWSGLFHDHGDGFHEWQPGQTANSLVPWGSEEVSVELYGQGGAPFVLSVLNADSGAEVGCSKLARGTDHPAVVRFQPQPNGSYTVRVRLAGKPAGPFHLVALGGNLALTTAGGSVSCPADGGEVIAVGAVNGDGRRAVYSSCGPNSRQPKPDFVAAVPFPSLWRSLPFTGTSAAAPQAAGLAALVWSRHPFWTAEQVHATLKASALDLGPPGHDWETGYGLVRLPLENTPATGPVVHTALRP